jgi:hypothetical protein
VNSRPRNSAKWKSRSSDIANIRQVKGWAKLF